MSTPNLSLHPLDLATVIGAVLEKRAAVQLALLNKVGDGWVDSNVSVEGVYICTIVWAKTGGNVREIITIRNDPESPLDIHRLFKEADEQLPAGGLAPTANVPPEKLN